MNEVDRYGPSNELVLYTDYAALQQELAAAREALQAAEADTVRTLHALRRLYDLITYPSNDHDETIPEIVEAERVLATAKWKSDATLQRDRQP